MMEKMVDGRWWMVECIFGAGITLALSGCAKPAPASLALPEIPQRSLKDPSGLAFDGEAFYVADWTGGGLLRLGPGAPAAAIAAPQAPIQAAAARPGELFLETNDGTLWWLKPGSGPRQGGWVKLHRDFQRQAGSPFCWDGIYLWFWEEDAVFAAFPLANGDLAELPETRRRVDLDPAFQPQAMACGWSQTAALVRSQDGNAPGHSVGIGGTALAQTSYGAWPHADWTPVSLVMTGPDRAVVLAASNENQGYFRLIPWIPEPAPALQEKS